MKRQHCIILLLILFCGAIFAQSDKNALAGEKVRYQHKKQTVRSQQTYLFEQQYDFTSVVVQADYLISFEGAYVISGTDTFELSKDEHVTSIGEKSNANMISFPEEVNNIRLYSGGIRGEVNLYFLNGSLEKTNTIPTIQNDGKSNGCDEPESIDQSAWRSGLKAPDYTRSFHEVKHVIIHHSAGSNTNTNYTQVVRDIYLYHTEVNGWSDIGYNYVIAQDGTIFKGRDPDTGAQDDVRGAHFCGKNSNTMGICLLGTYTTISPTEDAVNALHSLITWKLDKEGLNPQGFSPLADIAELGVVAGHRDGCATLCPGQKTYDQLVAYRTKIEELLNNCNSTDQLTADFTGSPIEIEVGEEVRFVDLSLGSPNEWSWSFEGGTPGADFKKSPAPIRYYTPGVYEVSLQVSDGTKWDIMVKKEMIRVRKPELPRIFPNPVNQGGLVTLELEFTDDIQHIYFNDLSGRIVSEINEFTDYLNLDLSHLKAGYYLIHIVGNRRNDILGLTIL